MLKRFLTLLIVFFCVKYAVAQPMDAMLAVGQGNPGALTAIADLYNTHKSLDLSNDEFEELLNFMVENNLTSSNVWVLYKDISKEKSFQFFVLLKAYHQGLISKSEIDSSLARGELMLDKSLLEQVSVHYRDIDEL